MAITTLVFDCFGVVYNDSPWRLNSAGRLNMDIVELLADIGRTGKYKIALLSNIGRDSLQKILDDNSIAGLFDVVLASSETAYVKPQREIFELLEDRIGTPFSEWLFIDDSRDNAEAAASYGIRSHIFTTAEDLRRALAEAAVI